MVLDVLGTAGVDAATAYVDDLKQRFSSPWSLKLGCKALGLGAAHLGIVYECGEAGKSTVSFDGVEANAVSLAPIYLNGCLQGGTPRVVSPEDDSPFLGIPDGPPQGNCLNSVHGSPTRANQAVRLRILRKVSRSSAIALRVAVSQASRCPWHLLARRYYLARAEAKVLHLLPFVAGLQIAGARVVNIQARWALAAATGRTTWAHNLKVPAAIRRQLCSDLGWRCLWTTSKVSAITLFMKTLNDSPEFAHSHMAFITRQVRRQKLANIGRIPCWS